MHGRFKRHTHPPSDDHGQFSQRGPWEGWAAMLVEEAHGGADADIAEISRAEAEQIAAVLAARN